MVKGDLDVTCGACGEDRRTIKEETIDARRRQRRREVHHDGHRVAQLCPPCRPRRVGPSCLAGQRRDARVHRTTVITHRHDIEIFQNSEACNEICANFVSRREVREALHAFFSLARRM